MGRVRARTIAAAVAAVALVLGTALTGPPAAAITVAGDDAVVDFEAVTAGTTLDTQYQASRGVVFGTGATFGVHESGTGCSPAAPVAAAAGGGVAARVPVCGGPVEFPYYAAAMRFTSFHNRVSVRSVALGSGTSAGVLLQAYDVKRQLLASSPFTAAGGFAEISLAQPRIAFVVVAGARDSAFDDLRVDTLATPLDPTVSVSVPTLYSAVYRGGTVSVDVAVLRFNGSNGRVELSLGDAPSGTAAFSTNPVSGSVSADDPASGGRSSILTLHVDERAAFGDYTPTVHATPKDASAGPVGVADAATFPLIVVPPFELRSSPGATVAPCETVPLSLDLQIGAGYTSPITLTSYPGTDQGVTISLPPRFTPGFSTLAATVTAAAGTPPGDSTFSISAYDATGYTSSTRVSVQRVAGGIVDVRTPGGQAVSVDTARYLAGGTTLTVRGRGFCPGSRAFFGPGDSVGAPLTDIRSSTGTDISAAATVTVPDTATTGPVRLDAVVGSAALTVRDFRTDTTLREHNFLRGGYSWNDLYAVFGHRQLDLTDPCGFLTFGLAECVVQTPAAIAFHAGVQNVGSNGNCWGMAYASLQISRGRTPASQLQAGARSVADLSLATPAVADYVHRMHVVQLSAEALASLNRSYGKEGLASLRSRIEGVLAQGRPAMITIRSGGEGHAVAAYRIETTADGYDIHTYDSNKELTAAELASGDDHAWFVARSVIHVSSTGWSFLMGKDTWTGGFATIGAEDPGAIPAVPSIPGIGSGASATGAVILESASDLADPGRAQVLPLGEGADGPVVLLMPSGETTVRLARGATRLSAIDGSSTGYTVAGTVTQIAWSSSTGRLAVSGAAGTTVSLLRSSGSTTERALRARFATAGRGVELGISSAGALSIDTDAAARLAITLGSVSRSGTSNATLGALALRAGERATVARTVWASKHAATVKVSKGSKKRTLALRTHRAHPAAVTHARAKASTAKKGVARVTVRAKTSVKKGAKLTSAAVEWKLVRGRKTVRSGVVRLSTKQRAVLAKKGVVVSVPAAMGRYTLRANVVLVATVAATGLPSVGTALATARVRVR
ncbi:hypothetical protein QT381_13055 [Galbitalea sp. SE-J8]|uniref:hypothetical protein n=1 Tax=Galbitalea sp. SE-J8 TaxID=3054952 RepID=UPI00259C903B|nr:hypothetical protein [Galbitalea sp. SE-J8]MDM4763936.1 hypothetical protein [Galbitalea sp. SE-J8]